MMAEPWATIEMLLIAGLIACIAAFAANGFLRKP